MVAVNEILREQFEVQSGGILSTGGQALGYNVIDTRYEPTDPRHIVRTFDNAQAAQNYNNEINARLRSNPNFDPRAPSTPAPLRADPADAPDNIRGRVAPQSGSTQYPRVPMGDITDINDSRLVGTDELTRQQRNELRSNGRVVIGQLTYLPDDIAEADRRFARWIRTTEQTSLAKMNGQHSPQVQARNNLRLLRSDLAGSVIRRTFIPVAFSPSANAAAVYQMRDMLLRKQLEVLNNEAYTAEMYDQDVQRVMGAWWIATLGPLILQGLRGGIRLSSAAMRALTGRVKQVIDAANGTPSMPRSRNPGRWVSYLARRFWDFVQTEASAATVVTLVGRWEWAQEQFLWLLSLAYISDATELAAVTGDALETIVRRGFPEMLGGVDTWDSMQDYIQNELGLDIDAPLTTRGADAIPGTVATEPARSSDFD